jgi:hypothetical protein
MTAGLILAVLLTLAPGQPGATTADDAFAQRLEAMRGTVARVDLATALLRQQSRFWQAWRKVDAAVEERVRAGTAQADTLLAWRDPELRGDYLGWLLDELLCNAEYLHALGRPEWGLAMLRGAEALADPFLHEGDLPAMLLANTMARLLMAGWRDSDDPISTMTMQTVGAATNVRGFRAALNLSAEAMGDIPMQLPAGGLAMAVRRAVSLLSPAYLLRTLTAVRAGSSPAGPGHAVEPDEMALAVNLPLALTSVGGALESFLQVRGEGIPAGMAVCLGSGDGAEPLRIAALDSVTSVLAVDHARLAVARMERMRQRLRNLPGVDKLVPRCADVAELKLGASSASLVVANHLLEYLEDGERADLYRRIGTWLRPGGVFFANVHVAEGSRYEQLVRTAGNVVTQPGASRVRVIIENLVPANPAARQVQHFFLRGGLEAEIAESLLPLPGQFELAELVLETGSGFVEAVCVVRKISQ